MVPLKDLVFPYCWVCGTRFVTAHPPGPALEERHHLFPQAAGGTDGPVVSLCDTHHTKLHKVAYAITGKRDHRHLLLGENEDRRQKVLWLASLVVKAEALTKDDPNRPMKVMLSLDKNRQAQVAWIRSQLRLTSNTAVLEKALDVLTAVLRKGGA